MGIAVALTPRVRIMVVCDAIRNSTAEVDVYNLKGVRQKLVADGFPCGPVHLRVFLLLSSSRPGTFPAYIRVVSDRTDRTIFQGYLRPPPMFTIDEAFVPAAASIDCYFPEPGQYSVQAWFFHQGGSDALKGELPFTIATQDE